MLHSVCTQVKIKMGVIHCFIILSLVLFNVFCLRLSDKSAPKHVSCMEHCMTIYPNQVLNYSSEVASCRRGCRFFSIVSFLSFHNDNNQSVEQCDTTCDDAYSNITTKQLEACKTGCHAQQLTSYEIESSEDSVDAECCPMLATLDGGSLTDGRTGLYLETNIGGQDNSATPILGVRASQLRSARKMDDGVVKTQESGEKGLDQTDCLTYLAHKTGISRSLLSFFLLATAVVMIWICLSAAFTAPEQRLSVKGDLEYLRSKGDEKFKLLRPQAQVEARPLPIKIKVDRI